MNKLLDNKFDAWDLLLLMAGAGTFGLIYQGIKALVCHLS